MGEFYEKIRPRSEARRRAHDRHQADGEAHRLDLREVRQAAGHQVGQARQLHRLHRLSRLHLHARAYRWTLPTWIKADLTEQGDEEYCENCGRPMVLKKGRFGTFFACSGYPDCKTTKQIGGAQKKPDQPLDEKCPQLRQQSGAQNRPLRRVYGLQQLPHLQVREAENHRREVPGVLRRRDCRSAAPRRARRSTAAIAIPIANSSLGASPSRRSARSAAAPTWWRSGSRPDRCWQCPNAECKHKQPMLQPVEALVQ